ncbi:hypothetical protein [Micromonospora arida]
MTVRAVAGRAAATARRSARSPEHGSFATAGVASAGCGIGLAVTAPLVGRLLGRPGARPVLLATGLAHLLALLGLAVTTEPVAFVALATVAGLSTPPAVGSGRAHLARLSAPPRRPAHAVNAVRRAPGPGRAAGDHLVGGQPGR